MSPAATVHVLATREATQLTRINYGLKITVIVLSVVVGVLLIAYISLAPRILSSAARRTHPGQKGSARENVRGIHGG
ncbi:hypothetical protein PM082_017946 [Marasmius tenuissimus]|nr:hypothetical protein PM082_017946 [Marasmius tenuissimus]